MTAGGVKLRFMQVHHMHIDEVKLHSRFNLSRGSRYIYVYIFSFLSHTFGINHIWLVIIVNAYTIVHKIDNDFK